MMHPYLTAKGAAAVPVQILVGDSTALGYGSQNLVMIVSAPRARSAAPMSPRSECFARNSSSGGIYQESHMAPRSPAIRDTFIISLVHYHTVSSLHNSPCASCSIQYTAIPSSDLSMLLPLSRQR